jgi:hypothetical protein
MVTVTEVLFVIAPAHIIVSMRFRPQTLRVTQPVSVHREMPKKLNKVFTRQPSYPRGRGSKPPRAPRPLGYFGLPMMNPGILPLPPNIPSFIHNECSHTNMYHY